MKSALVVCLGKDISEERDESILRRVIKRGEGYEPTNEDSIVEVNLKGTYQGEVFDERTVSFIAGAGRVENIPSG
jgi:FKBP-type peptidyl-prolyl cis-trans isomerase